jgi:IclR family transcriptional regulator, pca regulon regulatory protein
LSTPTPSAGSPDGGGKGGGSYTVSALAKGLRVLSIFSEQRRDLRLVDVAALTGFPTPTVFRLLKTLETEGYIEQLAGGRFRPGPYVLTLGYAALQGEEVVGAASLPLQRLADQTAETVNLGVLVGASVLYLTRIKNADLVTANLQVGSTLPAAGTSLGKVLLAALSDPDLDARIEQVDLSACHGPHAARSVAQLRHRLEEVRERGWAMQDEEVAHGLRSIAAPVQDRTGVVAAINVAVQASRWTSDQLVERFLPPLLAAAGDISRRLGHMSPADGERRRPTA